MVDAKVPVVNVTSWKAVTSLVQLIGLELRMYIKEGCRVVLFNLLLGIFTFFLSFFKGAVQGVV